MRAWRALAAPGAGRARGRAGVRAGCGLAPGPTRATRGELRSRRGWSSRRGTGRTDGTRGGRGSRLAVTRGAAGSLAYAVHPAGAISLRSLLPSFVPAQGPVAGPWPVPGRRRPPSSSARSACRFRALVAKLSAARPNSDGQTRLVSWPPPAACPALAGWLPSDRLTQSSRQSTKGHLWW